MNGFFQNNLALLLTAALATALLALALCLYLLMVIRRHRQSQKVIMGAGEPRDLESFARSLQEQVDTATGEVQSLRAKLAKSNRHIAECLVFRSVLHYDAYRDLSGMQSFSMALLDAGFSGVVISLIQSRDHARVYVREITEGESRDKLSPEEIHVLKRAMGLEDPVPETAAGGSDA